MRAPASPAADARRASPWRSRAGAPACPLPASSVGTGSPDELKGVSTVRFRLRKAWEGIHVAQCVRFDDCHLASLRASVHTALLGFCDGPRGCGALRAVPGIVTQYGVYFTRCLS